MLIEHIKVLGCQSVTITGGGEPVMHHDFNEIVRHFVKCGIQVGLVTNGMLLDKVEPDVLNLLTWCRISCADEREFRGTFLNRVSNAVIDASSVDWAFSYVLSDEPSVDNLIRHIAFAYTHNFTHVRIVSDLLHVGDSKIDEVRKQVEKVVNTTQVIWQGRKEFTKGSKRCNISLLKPVIGPDGMITPCCGVQYATEVPSLDLTKSMEMGHWRSMASMFCYDGSNCFRCYYSEYNTALEAMLGKINHIAFV